jgi:hypothetical protein
VPLASRGPIPSSLTRMPPRATSSDDLNAMIERVAPDVLALLADGVPRNKAAIVAVLADRHPKQDVKRAIARLSVIGQVELRACYRLHRDWP